MATPPRAAPAPKPSAATPTAPARPSLDTLLAAASAVSSLQSPPSLPSPSSTRESVGSPSASADRESTPRRVRASSLHLSPISASPAERVSARRRVATESAPGSSPVKRRRCSPAEDAQHAPSTPTPRKGARIFSRNEHATLERSYAVCKFPDREELLRLAHQFGKHPRKIRTWFNNRRSSDRKDNIPIEPPPVHTNRSIPKKLLDHAVNFPVTPTSRHTTPSSASSERNDVESAVDLSAPQTPVPPRPSGAPDVVALTPERWRAALDDGVAGHSAAEAATRVPHPWHVRRATLSILTTAEVAPDPATSSSSPSASPSPQTASPSLHGLPYTRTMAKSGVPDSGLEVKFLFGKRRIAYEWYCGKGTFQADAMQTGGPYAKVEFSFSSVSQFAIRNSSAHDLPGACVEIHLKESPTLLLQPQHSIARFQTRSQQRQYARVSVDEFPVPQLMHAKHHRIFLRADDARRLRTSVTAMNCELRSLLQTHNDATKDVTVAALRDSGGGAEVRTTPDRSASSICDLPADTSPSTPLPVSRNLVPLLAAAATATAETQNSNQAPKADPKNSTPFHGCEARQHPLDAARVTFSKQTSDSLALRRLPAIKAPAVAQTSPENVRDLRGHAVPLIAPLLAPPPPPPPLYPSHTQHSQATRPGKSNQASPLSSTLRGTPISDKSRAPESQLKTARSRDTAREIAPGLRPTVDVYIAPLTAAEPGRPAATDKENTAPGNRQVKHKLPAIDIISTRLSDRGSGALDKARPVIRSSSSPRRRVHLVPRSPNTHTARLADDDPALCPQSPSGISPAGARPEHMTASKRRSESNSVGATGAKRRKTETMR